MGQKQIRDRKFLIRFFNFPIFPSCMLALEPCRVHICRKDIITELDNSFQQNTRHTGRPSRHSRSIPMRRMFPNWAHRHRPPASHAPTGGASVADVLPEGKITTRRHLRSPLTACRASWKMFCQKGRLPRGKHFRPPLPACRTPWQMFCRKGRLPRGGTSAHRPQPAVPRGRCFAGMEKCPTEESPAK